MASVFDVAAFILHERGGATNTIALQKLVYYAQAWSLVWDGKPLFREPVEAWKHGPVVRDLWQANKNSVAVTELPLGDANVLDSDEQETVRAVMRFYGQRAPWWLKELTHREAPWREARGSLPPDARSNEEITHEQMRRYYGATPTHGKQLPESLLRGLDILVNTPRDAVDELLDDRSLPADDVEDWLATGAGDPWNCGS